MGLIQTFLYLDISQNTREGIQKECALESNQHFVL